MSVARSNSSIRLWLISTLATVASSLAVLVMWLTQGLEHWQTFLSGAACAIWAMHTIEFLAAQAEGRRERFNE